jgi:hypothetical protein
MEGAVMIPIKEYWHAVAKGIDAENEKVSQFINHPTGLGTAREAILRHFMITHLPEPFEIGTGFVSVIQSKVGSSEPPNQWVSMQCDLLVHNPQIARPYYGIENLVVVPRCAAQAVVEVKSQLDDAALSHMNELWENLHWLPVNVLGFAYDGWEFDTFVAKLAEEIRTRKYGVPDCIAVHSKNYLFVRTGYRLAKTSDRHHPAKYQVAVDFGKNHASAGLASGSFLDTFLRQLPTQQRDVILDAYLRLWFNQLQLPADAKRVISDDGTVSSGLLPG